MANTTSVNVKRVYKMDEITLNQIDEPKPVSQGMITVEVRGGVVIDVKGIPDGYQYEILDHDNEPEPEALYLATVNILVRATSPEHAAGIIIFALNYDRDDEALVDWDYATLDGWRRYPRFVSTSLGPENIAELLDRIAT